MELATCEQAIDETVNIGSNSEISVGDTLNNIKELKNSDVVFVTDEQRIRPEKSEVFRLWCDNTKIRELMGFTPQVDIREDLKRTIDWISDLVNLKNYKANLYNV